MKDAPFQTGEARKRRRQAKKKSNEQKKVTKIVDFNPNVLIIT